MSHGHISSKTDYMGRIYGLDCGALMLYIRGVWTLACMRICRIRSRFGRCSRASPRKWPAAASWSRMLRSWTPEPWPLQSRPLSATPGSLLSGTLFAQGLTEQRISSLSRSQWPSFQEWTRCQLWNSATDSPAKCQDGCTNCT